MIRNRLRPTAVLAAVLGFLVVVGIAPSASATDNATYYAGSTWNPWTNNWPTSYAGGTATIGRVNHGASYKVYQSGSTQYSQILHGSGSAGNSVKFWWNPCSGSNYLQPCYSSSGVLTLKNVQLVDEFGTVATATPRAGYDPPHMFAEESNGDGQGQFNYFLPHVNGLGNIDYVQPPNGYGPVPMDTVHNSGTGGFQTPIPLGWSPELCWNFKVESAFQPGTFHFYVCHSLVPHRL